MSDSSVEAEHLKEVMRWIRKTNVQAERIAELEADNAEHSYANRRSHTTQFHASGNKKYAHRRTRSSYL